MTQSGHSLIGNSSRIRGVPNTYGSNVKSGIVRGGRSKIAGVSAISPLSAQGFGAEIEDATLHAAKSNR